MGDKAARLTGTVFGIGYLPLAPGTFGSLAGLGVYMLIKTNIYVHAALLAASVILGFLAAGKAGRVFGSPDPKEFVMDEFAAVLLAFLFVPFSALTVVAGFLLFRLIDIVKPFPLRRLEKVRGGAGIMLDDIAAGVITNAILRILAYAGGIP